jgi:hypothetical protein
MAIPPEPQKPARDDLPMNVAKDHLLGAISRRNVALVVGATGCGKSTQVPQLLMEEARDTQQPLSIVCAQPRKVAAISLAKRVAHERGEALGHTVGYMVRHDSKSVILSLVFAYSFGEMSLDFLCPLATPKFAKEN